MSALARANEIRVARAVAKRSMTAATAAGLLLDPPWFMETMSVVSFLAAIPKVGKVKARRMTRLARMSESKTLGGMSVRQRRELLAELLSNGYVPKPTVEGAVA